MSSEADLEAAVARALDRAQAAEQDCHPDSGPVPAHRPTAPDPWPAGESAFVIEIGGHELRAHIPSSRSSVSDPNELEESDYERDGASSDDGDEEEDDYDDEDDEDDGDDGEEDGEYEEDYQFTRGDFDEAPAKELQECRIRDESVTPTAELGATTADPVAPLNR